MKRYKVIEFDTGIFSTLYSQVVTSGGNPRRDQVSFLISIEGAVAFYKHACRELGGVPQGQDPASDVVFNYNGIPVRVRAALQPPESVGILPREQMLEWDQENPPPRRGKRYRWC